jgi:hypothetical protein
MHNAGVLATLILLGVTKSNTPSPFKVAKAAEVDILEEYGG